MFSISSLLCTVWSVMTPLTLANTTDNLLSSSRRKVNDHELASSQTMTDCDSEDCQPIFQPRLYTFIAGIKKGTQTTKSPV